MKGMLCVLGQAGVCGEKINSFLDQTQFSAKNSSIKILRTRFTVFLNTAIV